MPDNEPKVPQAGTQTEGFLDEAPGGDLLFDELFPATDGTDAATTPQTEKPVAAPVTEPQATPKDEIFLKGEKSVYKTAEAAVEGLNKKDALIDQLRQRYISEHGIDPVTNERVPTQQDQVGESYLQKPQRYFEDLVKNVNEQNAQGYMETQQKLIADTLAPYGPLLSSLGRQQALQVAEEKAVGVGKFVGSEEYTTVLQDSPKLKQAIEFSEADPRTPPNDLAELYSIAYWSSLGRRTPELLKAQADKAPASTPQTVQPTLSSSTQTPPTPGASPSISSSEGRKAIIAEAERRGVDKLQW